MNFRSKKAGRMRRLEKHVASGFADRRRVLAGAHCFGASRNFYPDADGVGRDCGGRSCSAACARPTAARQSSNAPSPFAEAEALFRHGSDEEAKQKIAEQLRQNPRSAEGYNLLGIIYTSEKNYAQALDAFQQALNIEPKSARTRNNIGNVYVAQQSLVLAEQEFRKALQLDPSNNDGNYNVGLVSARKGSAGPGHPLFPARSSIEYFNAAQSDSCLP